jgi:hypothetical protein
MAVRTKNLKIIKNPVTAITVYVIKLKRKRFSIPLRTLTTMLTDVFLQPKSNQLSLNASSMPMSL